jgi:hypothetical protein
LDRMGGSRRPPQQTSFTTVRSRGNAIGSGLQRHPRPNSHATGEEFEIQKIAPAAYFAAAVGKDQVSRAKQAKGFPAYTDPAQLLPLPWRVGHRRTRRESKPACALICFLASDRGFTTVATCTLNKINHLDQNQTVAKKFVGCKIS